MRTFRPALLLASALLALPNATAPGRPTPAAALPDAVEEDWQLVVATPDVIGVGPQITTCMRPTADDTSAFVAFDMGYREYPTFIPGGMQTQVWSSGSVLSTASEGWAQFTTSGETVTWTQRMSLGNGTVSYDINNGQSISWGKFGLGQQLSVSFPSSLASLAGYSPDDSASRSGASWESNLVTTLTLVQVRYYANGLLLATDSTPRTIIPAK